MCYTVLGKSCKGSTQGETFTCWGRKLNEIWGNFSYSIGVKKKDKEIYTYIYIYIYIWVLGSGVSSWIKQAVV